MAYRLEAYPRTTSTELIFASFLLRLCKIMRKRFISSAFSYVAPRNNQLLAKQSHSYTLNSFTTHGKVSTKKKKKCQREIVSRN